MERVRELLKEREQYLVNIKQDKEKALQSSPEGSLRVSSHGNRIQYYQRNDPKDFNGTYIKRENMGLVQKLAQKDYDKKVLQSAEKEIKTIQKYLSSYPKTNVEQIYENMRKDRQKLILPIRETDEQYVEKWMSVKYQGKDFSDDFPEFYTSKGERVRSKSEVIIANMLEKEKIPYRYEYPIYLKGLGKIYPDFTVLNIRKRKEIIYEHLGMMDEPYYAEKAIQKIAAYEKNGIFLGERLILTFETRKNPINQKQVELLIQHYFQ